MILQWFSFFSGTDMHIDPDVTDAFNALFSGHKWWVYLPKDLYEFNEEMTCDASCSDFVNFINTDKIVNDVDVALWYKHILPQLR